MKVRPVLRPCDISASRRNACFSQRCRNAICQYDKRLDQMLSQENRPTVQFQSTNGHAQNNSMPSHAAVHNIVGGNSIVFVTNAITQ